MINSAGTFILVPSETLTDIWYYNNVLVTLDVLAGHVVMLAFLCAVL